MRSLTECNTYQMLVANPHLSLMSPENVEPGKVPISHSEWKCTQKGLSLCFYNPAKETYLAFRCKNVDALELEETSLGVTDRENFDQDCM
jgi:hypothetical protein